MSDFHYDQAPGKTASHQASLDFGVHTMSPRLSCMTVVGAGALIMVLSLPAAAATLQRTSAFDYDAATGLLTKEIVEPGDSNLCLVTEYGYDAYGNKASTTTRNCNGSVGSTADNKEAAAPTGDAVIVARTTSVVYEKYGSNAVTTNALGRTETKLYDIRFGAMTSLTDDPNNLTTTWTYDNFGRKTLETRADGNRTQWDYLYCAGINGGTANCPAAGAYVIVTTPQDGYGVRNGPVSKGYYDARDRLIRSETQGFDGNGTSTLIYQDTQYDSVGRPYKKSRPYYAGQTAYWTTVTYYDALDRAIQIVEPDNSTSYTGYNGLTVTVTNPKGQVTSTTRNSQGQIVSVIDARNKILTYEYDPFGNLTKTTDPAGNVTTLVYDLRGRKKTMVDPDMGTWTYSYDALGQLVRQTDAKGQTTLLTYDKLGRMTKRSEADLISNWYYDAGKNGAACVKGIGKLCQAETSTGYNRVVAYDIFGRTSSVSTTIEATAYVTSYAYDSNGRLQRTTYPGNFSINRVYSSLGYLKALAHGSTGYYYWQANSLDAEGHLLGQTHGNGVVTQQTYNPANGRITAIASGAGNAVQNLTYAYDVLGNLTRRSDVNQNLIETFDTYDAVNRLMTATVNSAGAGIVATNYDYDDIGNIKSRTDVGSYLYPTTASARPHAVTRINLAGGGYRTYAWDANGNLTNEVQYDANNNPVPNKSRTWTYTSFNMPSAISATGKTTCVNAGTTCYQYGPEHQRVKETSSSQGTTIYLNPDNSGGLQYERQTKLDGTVEERHFLTAYGQVVAVAKRVNLSQWSQQYLHRDNLGSTVAVTNDAGAVVERLAYEPFGKRRFPAGNTDPNNTIVGVNGERGFTNHEHIDDLALIHMNGRIYDPAIGRFTSADPYIQSPYNLQSYNRYSYVINDPLLFTDPSGYRFKLGNILKIAVVAAAMVYAPELAASAFQSSYVAMAAGGTVAEAATAYTAASIVGGAAGGAFVGATIGAVAGGTLSSTIQGAVYGTISGGMFGAARTVGGEMDLSRFAAHGAAGCASGELQGGGCGRGALSAMAGHWTGHEFNNPVAVAVAGGTVSAIGGGKFVNGALTASFAYLFNECSGDLSRCVRALRSGTVVKAGWQDANDEGRGAGWRVTVREADGGQTMYGHLTPSETPRVGTVLDVNGEIANYASPTNGHSSGPHVHVQRWDSTGQPMAPGGISPVQNGVLRTPYQQVDSLHPRGHQGEDYVAPR